MVIEHADASSSEPWAYFFAGNDRPIDIEGDLLMRTSSAFALRLAIGVALGASLISPPTFAQSTTDAFTPPPSTTPSNTQTLESVRVDGHYDNGVGTSNAASQGVILGSLIQDIPLLRPGEVLEAVPGLVVTQHSGEGKANQYFLRGYNLDHGTDFATSVDGVPVNMPTNGHGQGYSDLTT